MQRSISYATPTHWFVSQGERALASVGKWLVVGGISCQSYRDLNRFVGVLCFFVRSATTVYECSEEIKSVAVNKFDVR